MSLTASAVGPDMTWRQSEAYSRIWLPFESSIAVTGRDGQCRPRPAKVAYASAISSGLVLGDAEGERRDPLGALAVDAVG